MSAPDGSIRRELELVRELATRDAWRQLWADGVLRAWACLVLALAVFFVVAEVIA